MFGQYEDASWQIQNDIVPLGNFWRQSSKAQQCCMRDPKVGLLKIKCRNSREKLSMYEFYAVRLKHR